MKNQVNKMKIMISKSKIYSKNYKNLEMIQRDKQIESYQKWKIMAI